jgi:hypothetical protein
MSSKSTRVRPRPVLAAVLVAVVSACANRPPPDLAQLDGAWEGRAVRSRGDNSCPAVVPYRMQIKDGNIAGEIYHYRTPGLIVETFEAYIETDGEMIARARPFGDDTTIRGYFRDGVFSGETNSESCTNKISLRPQRVAR